MLGSEEIYSARADDASSESAISLYHIDGKVLADDLHKHDCYEMTFFSEGAGRWRVGGGSGSLSAGSLLIVPPGTLHSFQSERGSLCHCLVARFPKAVFPDAVLELPDAFASRTFLTAMANGLQLRTKDLERSRSRFRMIFRSRGLLRLARLYALFELLSFDRWQPFAGERVSKRTIESREQIDTARRYIGNHFRQRLTRSEVATHLGMEESAFSRFFHRASGQTFGRYVASLRLQAAARLLYEKRSMPVADVARASGFSDLSAFNRQFRMRLGTTPSAYRKQLNSEWAQP